MYFLYKDGLDNMLDDSSRQHFDINYMVNEFYDKTISQADRRLVKLAFKNDINQEDIDSFFKQWDIEVYGGSKSLMLSYIKKANPEIVFSDYEGPRLTGLLNFYRFSNLQIIAHYTKLVRALNEKDIKPLIIKGGAMKYLRQDLPRVMGDIDIVTLGDDFNTACDVATQLGYEFGLESTAHSVDLHPKGSKSGAVDIHKYIDFETEYDKSFMKDLFKRGHEVKMFGTEAILPCNEDLLFVALTNMAKNLHQKTSSAGILYTLFDCKFLVDSKEDFNWNLVIENAKKANCLVQLYFAVKFINRIVPNLLPESIFNKSQLDIEIKEYSEAVIYYRFYIHDLKMRCKKLKIKNALTDFTVFKQYLKDKPKHFVLKRVKKSKTLVSLYLKTFNK